MLVTGLPLLLLWALIVRATPALALDASGPELTPTQTQRIMALGPWPPPPSVDPGNRVSGDARAIELGRRLFRDPRMSPVGYIACVTCHQPDRAFTDQRARAHGLADLPRNTPALANLRQLRWYGWGGASDSLWMASIRPMLDPREFDGNPTSITRIFERDPDLAACYRAVFREQPQRDAQTTIVNIGKAMAAFQETLVTGRTAFDAFRDAMLRKDTVAMADYPVAALRGLKWFVGAGACVSCHGGPNLTDGSFHAVVATPSAVLTIEDSGRLEDAGRLRASPMNLLGMHNDDRRKVNAAATRAVSVNADLRGRFRTPSLRNVAVTAPYMHDGRFEHLTQALQHGARLPGPAPAAGMSRRAAPRANPAVQSTQGGPINTAQINDLAAFLATLTDEHGERRPWSAETLASCS